MNNIYVFRNDSGKIVASATHSENGELISTDSQEYQDFLTENLKSPAPTWDTIRQTRDELIKSSDWIFFPDVTLKNKEAWLAYRQALRDIPSTFSNPSEVVWPEKP